MSQAKVDKYKEEKKNRAKIIKRKKITKALWIIIGAMFVGACIGFPIGKKLYKVNKANREANATISCDTFNVWSQQYYAEKYADLLGIDDATATDAATASDADSVSE